MAKNGNLRKFGEVFIFKGGYRYGENKNEFYSRWRHHTCAGRETTPSQGERYRGENGNLHKLG